MPILTREQFEQDPWVKTLDPSTKESIRKQFYNKIITPQIRSMGHQERLPVIQNWGGQHLVAPPDAKPYKTEGIVKDLMGGMGYGAQNDSVIGLTARAVTGQGLPDETQAPSSLAGKVGQTIGGLGADLPLFLATGGAGEAMAGQVIKQGIKQGLKRTVAEAILKGGAAKTALEFSGVGMARGVAKRAATNASYLNALDDPNTAPQQLASLQKQLADEGQGRVDKKTGKFEHTPGVTIASVGQVLSEGAKEALVGGLMSKAGQFAGRAFKGYDVAADEATGLFNVIDRKTGEVHAGFDAMGREEAKQIADGLNQHFAKALPAGQKLSKAVREIGAEGAVLQGSGMVQGDPITAEGLIGNFLLPAGMKAGHGAIARGKEAIARKGQEEMPPLPSFDSEAPVSTALVPVDGPVPKRRQLNAAPPQGEAISMGGEVQRQIGAPEIAGYLPPASYIEAGPVPGYEAYQRAAFENQYGTTENRSSKTGDQQVNDFMINFKKQAIQQGLDEAQAEKISQMAGSVMARKVAAQAAPPEVNSNPSAPVELPKIESSVPRAEKKAPAAKTPSGAPALPKVEASKPIAVGDRITWLTMDKQEKTGTVTQSGKTIAIKGDDGASHAISPERIASIERRSGREVEQRRPFEESVKAEVNQIIRKERPQLEETPHPQIEAASAPSTNRGGLLLRKTADSIEAKAKGELGRDRLTNTPKRAREAGYAEKSASEQIRIAETMRNIADAHDAGETELLAGVRNKAQVDTLESQLNMAKLNAGKKSQERWDDTRNRTATEEDVKHAKHPYPHVHGSNIRDLAEIIKGKRGMAELYNKAMSRARAIGDMGEVRDESGIKMLDDLVAASKKHGAAGFKLAGVAERLEHYKRLKALGIHDEGGLKSALHEYLRHRSDGGRPDPIKAMERELIGTKIPGYFPTPKGTVEKMLDAADIQPGHKVLEPSAGKGNIADAIRQREPKAELKTIEQNHTLHGILEAKGHDAEQGDFLSHKGEHDRIVMNPPFENGQDMEHVRHAYDQLKPGGKLVSITSEGPFFRQDRKAQEFRDWMEEVGGKSEKLPEGSFKDSERSTGVATRMVTIEKPAGKSEAAKPVADMSWEELQDRTVNIEKEITDAVAHAEKTGDRTPFERLEQEFEKIEQRIVAEASKLQPWQMTKEEFSLFHPDNNNYHQFSTLSEIPGMTERMEREKTPKYKQKVDIGRLNADDHFNSYTGRDGVYEMQPDHRKQVIWAAAEGKPVPQRVLNELSPNDKGLITRFKNDIDRAPKTKKGEVIDQGIVTKRSGELEGQTTFLPDEKAAVTAKLAGKGAAEAKAMESSLKQPILKDNAKPTGAGTLFKDEGQGGIFDSLLKGEEGSFDFGKMKSGFVEAFARIKKMLVGAAKKLKERFSDQSGAVRIPLGEEKPYDELAALHKVYNDALKRGDMTVAQALKRAIDRKENPTPEAAKEEAKAPEAPPAPSKQEQSDTYKEAYEKARDEGKMEWAKKNIEKSRLLDENKQEADVDAGDYLLLKKYSISEGERRNIERLIREEVQETGGQKKRVTQEEIRKIVEEEYGPEVVARMKPVAEGLTIRPEARAALSGEVQRLVRETYKIQQEIEAQRNTLSAEEISTKQTQLDQFEADIKGMLDILIPTRSQDGRNLSFHKLMAKTSFATDYWVGRALKKAGKFLSEEQEKKMRRELQDILAKGQEAMDKGNEEGIKAARRELALKMMRLERTSTLETISALRKAGLLTGVKTHVRNVMGNTAFAAMEEAARVPASIADLIISSATGRRTVAPVNIDAIASGIEAARTRGWQEAKEIMKHGSTMSDLENLAWAKEVNSGNKYLDTYANTVFRSLSAADRISKVYAYQRSIEGQLQVHKVNGVSRAAIEKMMPEIEAQAVWDAEVATFTNKNAMAEKLKRFRAGSDLGRFAIDMVMPFVVTPSNIVSRVLDYAVVGGIAKGAVHLIKDPSVGKQIVREGLTFEQQRGISQAIGRGAIGSALMLLGYGLAQSGQMTGSYQPQSGDKGRNDLANRPEAAIKVGGKWWSIGAISPLGNVMTVGATLARDGATLGNLWAVAGKTVLDQPMTQGAAEVIDALQDPNKRGEKVIGSIFGSFIPTAVSDAAAAGDDVQRDSSGFTGQIQRRIPGLRQQLDTKMDPFGRDLENKPSNAIDPFLNRDAREDSDPVVGEIVRLGVDVSMPNRKGKGYDFESDRYRRYAKESGDAIQKRMAKELDDPAYQKMGDDDRIDFIKKVITEERGRVRRELIQGMMKK